MPGTSGKITVPLTTNAEITQHFERSIAWLDANYPTLENTHNPILWWMIKQAAENSKHETLKNIYAKYKKNLLDSAPANFSTPMFDKFYRPKIPHISAFSQIYDYQTFFLQL